MNEQPVSDARQWGEGPDGDKDVIAYVANDHRLQSLLYDLDLLPEQLMSKPRDGDEWCDLFTITNHWRENRLAEIDAPAALRELVRLKNIHDHIEAVAFETMDQYRTAVQEYSREKPKAWAAASAIVEGK